VTTREQVVPRANLQFAAASISSALSILHRYHHDPMTNYLGIDIGGTKIASAIVDDAGNVLRRAQRPTEAKRGGAFVLDTAVGLARELLNGETVEAVGVGAGGQIDHRRGVVASATDVLPGWAGTRIAARFSDEFGVPVAVDNDVNALAVGEHRFGAAKGYGTVAFFAIGTGVGGALLIDGKVYHGAHFTGAEFGNMIIDIGADAREDLGGRIGTLEAYVSGHGLVENYQRMIPYHKQRQTGEDIAALARKNPSGKAVQAIIRTGQLLGIGLANIANIFDPELFVIGGGMASLGNSLLIPAHMELENCSLAPPGTYKLRP
jgi:glucokinase